MANIPDPEFYTNLQIHRHSINSVDFSPNSDFLAAASDDKLITIHSLNQQGVSFKIEGHKDIITSVRLATNFMVTASKDSTARLWKLDQIYEDICPEKESLIYRDHVGTVRSVDISLDETKICTASDDKTVRLWSPTTNRCLAKLSDGHRNWIRSAKFSKVLGTNYIASCGDDGIINIWDTRTKYISTSLGSKTRSLHYTSLQWNPQHEHILASSSTDSCVRVWDLRSKDPTQSYQVHTGTVTSVDFHESGKYMISSSIDSSWKIFDIFQGINIFTGKTFNGQMNHAKFSPNGEYFATASKDLLLWISNLPSSETTINEDDQDTVYDMPEVERQYEKNEGSTDAGDISSNESVSTENYGSDIMKVNKKLQDTFAKPSGEAETLNPRCQCVEFLREILAHVGRITDSVIELDKRIAKIEEQKKL